MYCRSRRYADKTSTQCDGAKRAEETDMDFRPYLVWYSFLYVGWMNRGHIYIFYFISFSGLNRRIATTTKKKKKKEKGKQLKRKLWKFLPDDWLTIIVGVPNVNDGDMQMRVPSHPNLYIILQWPFYRVPPDHR